MSPIFLKKNKYIKRKDPPLRGDQFFLLFYLSEKKDKTPTSQELDLLDCKKELLQR